MLPVMVRDLCFDVSGKRLLDGMTFHTDQGPRTVILGPNGARKSLRLCGEVRAGEGHHAARLSVGACLLGQGAHGAFRHSRAAPHTCVQATAPRLMVKRCAPLRPPVIAYRSTAFLCRRD